MAVSAQIKQFGCAVACLGALLCPTYAKEQTATGSMELYCNIQVYLRIRIDGLANNASLMLRLWATPPSVLKEKEPSVLESKWCSAADGKEGPMVCEPVKATIAFKRFNVDKEAAGTYVVEFDDGHRQTGSFKVVRTKQPKPFLCE